MGKQGRPVQPVPPEKAVGAVGKPGLRVQLVNKGIRVQLVQPEPQVTLPAQLGHKDRQGQQVLRETQVPPDHREIQDRQELQVRLDHPLQARLVQLERRERRERQVLLDLKARRVAQEILDRQDRLVRRVVKERLDLLDLLDQQVQ